MNKQSKKRLGYVGRIPGELSRNNWYTPPKYINLARRALGSIELDPFSSTEANKIVEAKRFFDTERSAFDNEWDAKTVFMNPPYSTALIKKAIERFLDQRKKHSFQAIILTNNATETGWFQALLKASSAVCLVNHRIQFYNSDGKAISGNTRGQAFFYFGTNKPKFRSTFEKEGWVS